MNRQNHRHLKSDVFKPGSNPLNYGDVQVTFEDFNLLVWGWDI